MVSETPIRHQKESNSRNVIARMQRVQKSFGEKQVLHDINMELYEGENLVVLGKSGSGKTVLIKCMVGLIEPDDGDLIVFDKNIPELNTDELNDLRKKIGFLFQSAAL